MGNFRFFNSTLGKLANATSKMNIFDEVIIESILKFVVLFNKAKHEVNMLEETFNKNRFNMKRFVNKLLEVVVDPTIEEMLNNFSY